MVMCRSDWVGLSRIRGRIRPTPTMRGMAHETPAFLMSPDVPRHVRPTMLTPTRAHSDGLEWSAGQCNVQNEEQRKRDAKRSQRYAAGTCGQ